MLESVSPHVASSKNDILNIISITTSRCTTAGAPHSSDPLSLQGWFMCSHKFMWALVHRLHHFGSKSVSCQLLPCDLVGIRALFAPLNKLTRFFSYFFSCSVSSCSVSFISSVFISVIFVSWLCCCCYYHGCSAVVLVTVLAVVVECTVE
jgi:hypothetical protein